MAISLTDIARLLSKHADPSEHTVFVDGEQTGTCTRATLRIVFSLSGVEFVVDYAYELDGKKTTFSSRLRSGGLGAGGREQILVNGQDVENDDVVIGADDSTGLPGFYVEFKYTDHGTAKRVKFAAPVTAFK